MVLLDPCKPRPLPSTGGLTGFLQDQVLKGLDRAACKYGSSREELVLAIADKQRAHEYERKYGVDPQLGRRAARHHRSLSGQPTSSSNASGAFSSMWP